MKLIRFSDRKWLATPTRLRESMLMVHFCCCSVFYVKKDIEFNKYIFFTSFESMYITLSKLVFLMSFVSNHTNGT